MDHEWLPDTTKFEAGALAPEVLARLQEMGHRIKAGGRQGDAHSIWIDPTSGIAYGINDRRSPDSKASR
jgi:gamma-glutamyltranspeptidase/glutathione hydrolase